MSYPLRIENSGHKSFITTRTRNSELWFVNNNRLQDRMLGYYAKYQEKYGVKTYAIAFQGNHYHVAADFNGTSRASFMRDFNSMCARLTQSFVDEFPGGCVWGRRYSSEALVNNEDLEDYFFYIALQAVHAGLCENIEDYPGFNSFFDAINEREKTYTVFEKAAYNDALRFNPHVKKRDFVKKYKLKFSRLPGYERLTKEEYKQLMLSKLHERRNAIVEERKARGLKFLGRPALLRIRPGSLPQSTKTSTRESKRPLILTRCFETKKCFLDWYFRTWEAFKEASRRLRQGIIDAIFPPGTYKPYVLASP